MNAVALYRDDGPMALAIGRFGSHHRPWLFALVAAAPVAAVAGAGLSKVAVFAATVWAVAVGGSSSGAPHTGRLDWTAVPLLRTAEYAVIAIVGLAGDVSPPLVFVLLCAIAFHDYDTVDRMRQGRAGESDRRAAVRLLGLGWDGRLLLVAVGYLAGQTTGVYIAATAYLWLLFAVESAHGWFRRSVA
ncbi:MAG: DUF5941 domain-containing protein [Actinomycetes bacterium]